jgi:putative transposase
VIWIDDERYRLHAAVDPDSNESLHTKLEPTRNNDLTEISFGEFREKHDVDDAVFLVDGATPLKEARHRHSLDFRDERHGNGNSVERILREVKRRTSSFSNCFRHVDPETADDGLSSSAFGWNQLI